ncbi:MAG: hypothetical protein KDB23_21490 [Planctomycetales bacterium]|nr:hypothetical protein [Planctomycetales bacterium]
MSRDEVVSLTPTESVDIGTQGRCVPLAYVTAPLDGRTQRRCVSPAESVSPGESDRQAGD